MTDTTLTHHILTDKDAKNGTLCKLSFSEHELLLKYEIIDNLSEKTSPHKEKEISSLVTLQEGATEDPTEILDKHLPAIQIPPSETPQDSTLTYPPAEKETEPYQRLIDLILQLPGMATRPQLRSRLLPQSLRSDIWARPTRFKLNAEMDLENIIDWAERNHVLQKVFINIKNELNQIKNKDQRKKLREALYDIEKSFPISERNNIKISWNQISTTCRSRLRSNINLYFNREDIRLLCFDAGIDYDSLAGSATTGKVISLIEEIIRQHRIQELIKLCEATRPNVDWRCQYNNTVAP